MTHQTPSVPLLTRWAAAVTVFLMTTPALAAGTEFDSLYNILRGWATGGLGKSISIIFLLVGLGMGAIRGSIVGAIVCISAALALVLAPGIIDAVFTVS